MGRHRVSLLLLAVILLSAKAFGNPVENSTNGTDIEGAYPENALDKWLGNFDRYMFMMEQDGDDDGDVIDEELFPGESSAFEEEEDYDQGSSSPITMTIKKPGGLLDPGIDYKVKLESLVAEGGSVLVTLGNFLNKTTCGVGGFSPPEPEGRLNISLQEDGNRSTTIVAFAVDTEEEETTTTWTLGDEVSEWEEHSHNLWWAMGRLAGGGQLTLIFTPPECGCLTLKAHYALPVGENLTLVVGPESYRADLEKLLCVDPSSHSIEENLIDQETDEEGAVDPLEEEKEGDDTDPSADSGLIVKGRGRWAKRKQAKLQRKKKRQEARQAIRQAGRRVTRQQVRQHMRLRRRDDEPEEVEETRQVGLQSGGQEGRRARKQARKAARKEAKKGRKEWKGKKPWKKHRKHARKNAHKNRHNRRNRNHNITEGATPLPEDAFEDPLPESDDHLNTTEPMTDEDALADILLEDVADDDDEEEEEEEYEPEPTHADASVTVSHRGRKHRRQRGKARKLRNKEKRKGTRFCCKQGIKFKKSHLLNSLDQEDQPEIACNNTGDIIFTYALHQFNIDSTQCSSRYETCCSKFTLELWENLKARRAAKRAKRKQQRKAARQQKRRQNRRQRGYSTTPMTSTDQ